MSENGTSHKELFPGSEGEPPEKLTEASCENCGVRWVVHRDLSGFRIKCRDCGAMVAVPEKEKTRALPVVPAVLPPSRRKDSRLVIYRQRRGMGIAVKGEIPEDGLDEVEALDVRRPLLNRTFSELFLIMAAFLVPHLLLIFLSTGSRRMFFHPVSTLASSILVILIVALFSPETFRDVKSFSLKFLVETLGVTLFFLGIAWLWQQMMKASGYSAMPFSEMREQWGAVWIVLMIGFGPGIFEELAFRGLLQSRFDILYGPKLSILYTGTAFALCHGVTLAFPIHVSIGIYLCWLRKRSESLLPGIILHTLYNSLVVVLLD